MTNQPEYPILWHKTQHVYDDQHQPTRDRESFILSYEQGSVEGWRTLIKPEHGWDGTSYYGGIELHRRTPPRENFIVSPNCPILGGDCYPDGSSLAYKEIAHAFTDPERMAGILAAWAPESWTEASR